MQLHNSSQQTTQARVRSGKADGVVHDRERDRLIPGQGGSTGTATDDPRPVRAGIFEVVLEMATTPLLELDLDSVLTSFVVDCTEALGVVGTAVLLVDGENGELRLGAASGATVAELASIGLEASAGPGVSAARSGRSAVIDDLATTPGPITAAALAHDLRSTAVIPLTSGDRVVGSVQVFDVLPFSAATYEALTLVGSVLRTVLGNLDAHRRSVHQVGQLSDALYNRVPVEQAKGVPAQRHGVDVTAAFRLLRTHARRHRVTVLKAAQSILAGASLEQSGTAVSVPSQQHGQRVAAR